MSARSGLERPVDLEVFADGPFLFSQPALAAEPDDARHVDGSAFFENEGFGVRRPPQVSKAAWDAALARGAAAMAAQRDVLRSGESIVAKRNASDNRRAPHLSSRNNRAWLVLQSDGNLVLSTPEGKILWASKTRGADRLMVQRDGNIVLFDRNNRPMWASRTNRASEAAWGGNAPYLKLQDDGNLVLISGKVAVWSTDSNGFANRQDEGGWLENAAKTVGRAVESASHAVADLSSSVADTLGKVPLIGPGLKGLYGYTYGAAIASADNVVSGVRLDKVASRHFESQVQNVKQIAPYVQTIISLVPGIGPGISGAISAGLTLAQGRPIDEALVDAAAGALPGGAMARSMAKAAFAAASGKPLSEIAVSALDMPPAAQEALKAGVRVASDLAQGKRVDKSVLDEANRQIDRLPPELRTAAQVGVALGQGKNLQDIAARQLPRLIAVGGPLAAAGQKIASQSPIVRQARGLVAKGQHGFDVAQGLMAHSAVPLHQLQRARNAFTGEALKGFDTAVALHMGRVLSPPRHGANVPPAARAGSFVMKGIQGAPPAKILSIARAVDAADSTTKAVVPISPEDPSDEFGSDGWSDEVPVGAEAEIAPRLCPEKWRAELAAYPIEVRNAVDDAPGYGTLDVYLWAVRKGIRSEASLKRLIYFTLHGEQHGYCDPVTRQARIAWKEVDSLLAAYKKWPHPPREQSGALPCSIDSVGAIPHDQPALDITGRYYTLHPPATFVINQAGLHIEGVGSRVVDSSFRGTGDHRPVTEFQGDLSGGRFRWFNRQRPANFGQIAANNGILVISQGVDPHNKTVWEELRPFDERPTLRRVDDIDRPFDLIDRHELTPLTPEQMKFIRHILAKKELEQIFDLYFNRQKRDEAMGALVRRMVDTPDHASYVPRLETFHEFDRPLVRRYAQYVLTAQKWKSQREVIRSHTDWIQMMMDRTLQLGSAAVEFERYLGLRFDPKRAGSEGEHSYEFTIELTGASLILAGYVGTVTVEKTSGRKWRRVFDVELAGGTVALTLLDAKIGSSFKGAARSYLEWTENDVPGSVRLARASSAIGMDVASAQIGFMHVMGDESLPPLDVLFQEAGLGVPNINKILEDAAKGEGLSPRGATGPDISASVLFGSVSQHGSLLERLGRSRKRPAVIDLSGPAKTDVSVTRALSSQTHFCLGSDRLTEAAVQALRIMCARELPLLMSPQSYLLVIGHADTLGRGHYDNEGLSRRRAENTIQAARDILGGKFQIRNDGAHIQTIAAGDKLAAEEAGKKPTPAPKHRRVQVFLNSVLVLTLFGSGITP
jgi:outer membrane protein OmpA-like peptidoglycan-associated protein